MSSPTLDATIQVLQNGSRKISLPIAIQNIDVWINQLGANPDPSVKPAITDLQNLKSLLQAGTPDDAAISTLFKKLSKEAAAAGGSNSKLRELGTILAR